ncbi:MAG: guanylate kinase, partial [Lachnospiraceae bacterium]|nr:guanylate kinase [Lachnospiraceae bacterium]
RPIRAGEKDGQSYRFCSAEERDDLDRRGKIIEMRSYNTVHGRWDYFTVDDGNIDIKNNNYIVIGTIEAYEKLRDYFGLRQVVPIYIEIEDGVRLSRALERERSMTQPRYEEMCRRFLADAEDFSEERQRSAGILKKFMNDDLDRCLDEITDHIKASEKDDYGY